MNVDDNISVFFNTRKIFTHNLFLHIKTNRLIKNTVIYPENFTAALHKQRRDCMPIQVVEGTTLSAAKKCKEAECTDRVAVLNFANPIEPGGGVLRGANAQEEYLCRCSNLYFALAAPERMEDYYSKHSYTNDKMFSDRVIYSHDVCVIKDDEYKQLKNPFYVDVLTCAAPYIELNEKINDNYLVSVILGRVRNILEAAIENKVDVLVLGAFGCGAFHNSPTMVAGAFYEALISEKYCKYFKRVFFAIKPSKPERCPNVEAFRNVFSGAVKKYSVLGDSISTYEGFNPEQNAVFYNSFNNFRNDLKSVEDTWWSQVIDDLGGELCVNNSYSGGMVSGNEFPAACSPERAGALHTQNDAPDCILIYIGFNDFGRGIPIKCKKSKNTFSFYSAYCTMLKIVKKQYPFSRIVAMTLPKGYIRDEADRPFPEWFNGNISFSDYNDAIRKACREYNVEIADIALSEKRYETLDGTHPTAEGHRLIAENVLKHLG